MIMSRNGSPLRSAIVRIAAVTVIATMGLAPEFAAAQDTRQLLNRLDRLEREVNDLQRQAYGAGGVPASQSSSTAGTVVTGTPDSYAARAEIRMQQLETQLRQLTGRLEELDYSNRQIADRLDKLVEDIDFRLRALEQGGGGNVAVPTSPSVAAGSPPTVAPSGAQPGAEPPRALGQLSQSDVSNLSAGPTGSQPSAQTGAAPSGPVLPEGPAVEQYKFAFDRLMKRDYPVAQAGFEEFLANHPNDPLSGNAAYWLGETYYVRGNFADAAVAFANGYQNYPGSSKTADNLLKLGMSLRKLERTPDACLALARLRDEFPNASRSIKRRAEQEAQLMQCPT